MSSHDTHGEPHVVAIGEVLWDIFGQEKHLGGAPFNYAVHCRHLGTSSAIVSRVGQDDLGDEIVQQARALGVDASLIQRDAEHPTGQVHVTLDAEGQPAFDICSNTAYDHLAADREAITRTASADVVCFGTLAQRHPTARASIAALLQAAESALIVCDLNLRAPHYSPQTIRSSLERCRLLKLNQDELLVVQTLLGQERLSEEHFARHLLDTYGIALVCVTLGARGCVVYTAQERVRAPGYAVQVVDTVGAGDAFAAALTIKTLAGEPLAQAADFANLVGAYVATRHGATPRITQAALEALINTHSGEQP